MKARVAAPKVAVIEVGAALDYRNAKSFAAAAREQLATGIRHVVIDFRGTGILDSSGLGALFVLHRRVTPFGGAVSFACVSAPVRAVIQLTRIYRVFRQFPAVDDAVRAAASPPLAATA